MFIRATNPETGGVSPFDVGELVRVHYATDGKAIEGDFNAYKKNLATQKWELEWTEADYKCSWYAWVEWWYPCGEWKLEFVDKVAGITPSVEFVVGARGEDLCYKEVVIHRDGCYWITNISNYTYTRDTLSEIQDIIDNSSVGVWKDVCCISGTVGNVVWCPDYETKKSHEICVGGKWESRQLGSCPKSLTKAEFIALIQEKGGRIAYEKISTDAYLKNAWYYHESGGFFWLPPSNSITYREDVAGEIRRVLKVKNIKTRNPPSNVADIDFAISIEYDPDGKTELVDYQWAVSCIDKLPFEEEPLPPEKSKVTFTVDASEVGRIAGAKIIVNGINLTTDINGQASFMAENEKTYKAYCTPPIGYACILCSTDFTAPKTYVSFMLKAEESEKCTLGDIKVGSTTYCLDGVRWKTRQICDLYGEWQLETNTCPEDSEKPKSILEPIFDFVENMLGVDRKTAEMYTYFGLIGVVIVALGAMFGKK